jgi:transposase-like protein
MKQEQKRYTEEFKNQVLEEYTNKTSTIDRLAEKYDINPSSIYLWKKQRGKAPRIKPPNKVESQDKPAPEIKKKNMPMALAEVRFCPCCGTDIIAVSIAMAAAKQGY